MVRSGPRSAMLFTFSYSRYYFFDIFLLPDLFSSSTFFFVSFSFLPQTNSRQVVQPVPAIGEFSSRGSGGDAREESLRLIKKIERVLFPLELSSDEQAAGGDSGQVGHWENFIPSGYRMARRKRVARAANPISRGNLDRDEPRQTWRTMRRNFQRGRIGGV